MSFYGASLCMTKCFFLKFRLCIKCSSFFAQWDWLGVYMSHCSLSVIFQNVNLSFQIETLL